MSVQQTSASAVWTFRSILVFAITGIIYLCGCGESDLSCPVSGQVRVDGKLAAGVYLIFQALNAESPEQGTVAIRTGHDGSFSSQLPEPGDYSVSAFWPKVVVAEGETIEGEDRFKGKYRDPQNPVLSIEILEGANSLPAIELSSK